jgi:hypothetical protein
VAEAADPTRYAIGGGLPFASWGRIKAQRIPGVTQVVTVLLELS